MNREKSIAITLVVVGIIMGAVGAVLDVNGAGSWIHAITWVGGGVFGYGLVTWIRLARAPQPFTRPSHENTHSSHGGA